MNTVVFFPVFDSSWCVFSFTLKCLWVISVDAQGVHSRMASTLTKAAVSTTYKFSWFWFFREWHTKMAHMTTTRIPIALKNERQSCRDVIWLGQQYHNISMWYNFYMGDKNNPSGHNKLWVIPAGVPYHITRLNTVLLGERARKHRVVGRPHIKYTPEGRKAVFQRRETHGRGNWRRLPLCMIADNRHCRKKREAK